MLESRLDDLDAEWVTVIFRGLGDTEWQLADRSPPV